MRPVLMVSAVIPVVMGLTACCGKPAPPREEDFQFMIDEADFLSALDADGNLTAEGCDSLCRTQIEGTSEQVNSVKSCEEIPSTAVTWAPQSTSTTPTPTSTGDTAEPEANRFIGCTAMVEEICVGGRDHQCIEGAHEGTGPTPLAAWLAAQAHAEATSVQAFIALGLELRRFGAESELVDRCAQAARDEVVHARLLRKLAGDRGGRPAPLAFGPVQPRSLLAFAIENAVEGCVRETWAALVATWQAGHAEHADVRTAYARIARDEARHGDLAWAIEAWLQEKLTPEESATVEAARQQAIAELRTALGTNSMEGTLCASAGLPERAMALELLGRLDQALWQVVAAEA